MAWPTIESFDEIIGYLRQQRDDFDKLIHYLEEVEKFRAKNSTVIKNPNLTGAAQISAGEGKIGTIGNEPQIPKRSEFILTPGKTGGVAMPSGDIDR